MNKRIFPPSSLKQSKRYIMKPGIVSRLIPAILLASALASNSLATEAQPAAAAPVKAERSMLVSASATVRAINLPTREVTLEGPNGNLLTLTVDTRVQRLNEVKVGDVVAVDYYISIAGEVRAPTEAEKANPLVVVEGAAKAPVGTSPAGGMLRTITAVMKVTEIDQPNMLVTLEGPNGNSITIKAESAENVARTHVGDTVVVNYTEALAVSLHPVAAPAAK